MCVLRLAYYDVVQRTAQNLERRYFDFPSEVHVLERQLRDRPMPSMARKSGVESIHSPTQGQLTVDAEVR